MTRSRNDSITANGWHDESASRFYISKDFPWFNPTASWMTPRAATAFSTILFPVDAPWYLRTIATCRRETLMSFAARGGIYA